MFTSVFNIFHPILTASIFFMFFIVIYVSLMNPVRLVAGITQSSHGGLYCSMLSSLTSTLPFLWLFLSLFNPPSFDPSTYYFFAAASKNACCFVELTCWQTQQGPISLCTKLAESNEMPFLDTFLVHDPPKVPQLMN